MLAGSLLLAVGLVDATQFEGCGRLAAPLLGILKIAQLQHQYGGISTKAGM